jgi:mono/diheme cytochrome c family protein
MPGITYGQVKFLAQNWDDATRQLFYTTTQGSRMIPYDWFMALEVSDGTSLFVQTRLPQLGYLPNNNPLANPDRLPVGFVADTDFAGRKYLGMTCAACHTNRIQYQGTTYQIDGAPTLADMWGLLSGIRDSLAATVSQEPKFKRFVGQVLGASPSDGEVAELRRDLGEFRDYWEQFVRDSNPDPTSKLTWGRGRLDAFGMIFNRVSAIDLELPANNSAPNAPVSYPFLWGTSWEDRVQWNASAPNRNDIERLGRNVGEVLGVFGETDLQRASLLRPYYRTSARRLNQVLMENWLKRLWSPQWPEDFPKINETKMKAGKELYAKHCVSCHEVIAHGKQDTPVKVVVTPVGKVGTDRQMALNAIKRQANTGRLKGSVLPPDFEPLPAQMPTGALLVNVVHGAVISPFHDVGNQLFALNSIKTKLNDLRSGRLELANEEVLEFMKQAGIKDEEELRQKITDYRKFVETYHSQLKSFAAKLVADNAEAVDMPDNPFVYKARPLDGIWATAPYLHNGSVPNLYELLLPADKRSKVFHVGNLEYDPVRVGFQTAAGPGTTEVNTQFLGNFNTGHDQYGNQEFTEEQRLNLLEYLKSL